MLAYIKGTLEMKMTGYVVIDVGGLGYKIYMTQSEIDELGAIGDQVKVYTYYKVREDDISIYGFKIQEELRMFELLIGVSGVGAKTALSMLAICDPTEFAIAIITEDIKTLTEIPGIGPKSAKRIILELKDKIKLEQEVENIKNQIKNKKDEASEKLQKSIKNNEKVDEAISALQVLGYNKREIIKVFEKLDVEKLSVEELIKKALIPLSK